MTASLGLTNVATRTLVQLRDKVFSGRLQLPLTEGGLYAQGMGLAWSALQPFAGCEASLLCSVIDAMLAEREVQSDSHLTLVWTGPEAAGSTARSTWSSLRYLFEHAQASVFIAGFSFDSCAELFATLHKKMTVDGLSLQIVVHTDRARGSERIDEHVAAQVRMFLRRNWPFAGPLPEIYVDPRTAAPDSLISMHAKCVVVDWKTTLIGSSNFTDRGQSRNIELGVMIDDSTFAKEVVCHWRKLIDSRNLVRVGT